jgi:hypothetical protein
VLRKREDVELKAAGEWSRLESQFRSVGDAMDKAQAHTFGLVRRGIPASVRRRVWPTLIGNTLRITMSLWATNLQRAVAQVRLHFFCLLSFAFLLFPFQFFCSLILCLLNSSVSSLILFLLKVVQQTILYENKVELALGEELGRERTVIRIDVDLPRTFPMLGLFGTTGPFHLRLKAVLQAFAMLRPDLGYVQGMSLIAAMLCLHVDAVDDIVSAAEGGAVEAGAEGGGGGARHLQSGLQRGMRKTKRAKAKRGAKVVTNTVPGHSGGMSRSLSSERLNEIRVGMLSRSASFDRLAAAHGGGGAAASTGRPRANSSGGGGGGRSAGPVPPEAEITSLALDSTAFVTYSCLTNLIVGYEHLFAFFSQDVEMIQACVVFSFTQMLFQPVFFFA